MMFNLFKGVLGSRFSGIIIIVITYLNLIVSPGESKPFLLWLTNGLIIFLSSLLVYSDITKTVTLKKVFGIFFLLFFGIAPILEYKQNVQYWGGGQISSNSYIFVNFLIILSIVLFFLAYNIFSKYSKNTIKPGDALVLVFATKNKSSFVRLIFPVFVSLFVILWFNDYNLYNLLLRGGELQGAVSTSNKAFGLFVNNFLRPFCFSALILCVFIGIHYSRSKLIWCYLFAPIAVFVCFPTSLPRFAVAALYIPLLLALTPNISNLRFLPVNLFVGSFFTIFPFLDIFRYVDEDFLDRLRPNFSFLTEGHFDAYQNLVRTVSLDIVTYGNQLVGAALFFVPRSTWDAKPIGSGELLALKGDLLFSNLSQSLLAEGYINFGIFGVMLFVVFFAYLSALLDRRYWGKKFDLVRTTFSLYYFQLIGLTVFILRGDLTNAFAYTCGFLASMVLACRIYKAKLLSFTG